MAHRFRFFVDATGVSGDVVPLEPADAAHARVLRLERGSAVDVVTARGELYSATVEQLDPPIATLRLGSLRVSSGAGERWSIELLAGVLTGGAFDELVDGAVQAGAARIVPVAASSRELERITSRADRLTRVAKSAAKQAKRLAVPELSTPILFEQLVAGDAGAAGIVLDAGGACPLSAAVEHVAGAGIGIVTVRLYVGPSQGLEPQDVAALAGAGWIVARLGPTVLRSQLAAAVAVAQVAALLADGAN